MLICANCLNDIIEIFKLYNNRASVRQKQGLSDSAPEPEPLALKDFKLKATLGRGAFGKVG